MNTMTNARTEWEQKARDNFRQNFAELVDTQQKLNDINLAEEAADQAFGYTHKYNEPGYVKWTDRLPAYLAIVNPLQALKDDIIDRQNESMYAVQYVITSLPPSGRREVAELVDKYLTNDNQ